jgi:hypothetical protein
VKQMVALQNTILLARERKKGKRTFRSFPSLSVAHAWMQTMADSDRNLYQVDLSAWDHTSLTDTERRYITDLFVSPLVLDVEWLSVDSLPDPHASQRMTTLKTAVLQALELGSPAGFGTKERSIQVEHLGRKPKGKTQFKNSYHVVVPGAVFEHNARGCMKDFVQKVLWLELEKKWDVLFITGPTTADIPKRPSTCILDTSVYTRGRQMRMPGCCKYGGVGLPVASLAELQRMRTSYHLPELARDTQIITVDMVATLCPPPPPSSPSCPIDVRCAPGEATGRWSTSSHNSSRTARWCMWQANSDDPIKRRCNLTCHPIEQGCLSSGLGRGQGMFMRRDRQHCPSKQQRQDHSRRLHWTRMAVLLLSTLSRRSRDWTTGSVDG